MRLLSILLLSLVTSIAVAHHGRNGQFDTSTMVDVTGVITSVQFVNPHGYVYFDVTDDMGGVQNWRCELDNANGMRRKGWTKDMFSPGTTISIQGPKARREEFGCSMETIAFAGGSKIERDAVLGAVEQGEPIAEVELAPGTPVIHGRWKSPTPVGDARRNFVPAEAAVAAAAAAWPEDVEAPTGRRVPFATSAAGRAAASDFTSDMNPRFNCQATNLFHDWEFHQTVNTIEQSDDKIVITYGFMDIVRTIHLDMESQPENITPSRAGHSIGKWEGSTLIVDTIGFEEGYLAAVRQGVKHSEQMHTVEKFNLSDDGEWLVMTYTINDPLYLEQPFTAQLIQGKTLEPFTPYDCVELTQERQ